MGDERGWIGVDLDGTLAVDNGRPFAPGHIGAPIPAMLARVQKWLAEGREVRIVTARVGGDTSTERGHWEASQARRAIEKWCETFVGRALRVTASKDYMMEELWDDRAVQVVKNQGVRADGRKD